MAGQGPDLFAFYDINGFNPPALRAEAVCADLLPLTVDFLTELLNPETMITKNNGIMLNTKDHPNNRMVLCE